MRIRDRPENSSNPVAPTFFRNEPFGENVEGLSHFGDESCAVERAVQTHDFEDSTLCIVVGGKPLLLPTCLRSSKTFAAHSAVSSHRREKSEDPRLRFGLLSPSANQKKKTLGLTSPH